MKTESPKIPDEQWSQLPWYKRNSILIRVLLMTLLVRLQRRRSSLRAHFVNDRRRRYIRPVDLVIPVGFSQAIIFACASLSEQPIYLIAVGNILLVALVMLPTTFSQAKQ